MTEEKRDKILNRIVLGLVIAALFFVFSATAKTDITQKVNIEEPVLETSQIIETSQITQSDDKTIIPEMSDDALIPETSDEAALSAGIDTIQESRPEYVIKHGKIKNKPIYTELTGLGLSPTEVLKLSKDFKKVFNFKKARPGDEYTLFLSDDNRLKKFIYKRDVFSEYIADWDTDCYKVRKHVVTLDKETVVKDFTLDSSLFQAILAGHEKQTLASEFAEIFSWDIDFYLYPRKGDKIQIQFEKFNLDGNFVKYGKILAARYISKNKTFTAFRYNDGKFESYYDETGLPLRKMFLKVPVKAGVMTSSYKNRRFHPVSKKYKKHSGIDYGARTGTSIFSTANGVVKFAGVKGGYGKLLIVSHPNGYETYYAHCSRLLAKKGAYVDQGDVIAKVGSTGVVTGPHVHYEIRINRKPVNPNTVKSSRGKALNKKRLPDFRKVVAERLVALNSLGEVKESESYVASSKGTLPEEVEN